jgi:hypothetical protein
MTREDATRILNFWEAFDRVIPMADPWMQTAEICTVLERIIAGLFSANGQRYEIRGKEQFMPPQWVAPVEGKRVPVATSSK